MWRSLKDRTGLFAHAAAVVLTGHFLLGLLLAASPELHHHLHHDSQVPGHTCFVTVLSTGHCTPAGDVIVATGVAPAICWVEFAPSTEWVESVFQASAVFEHAPPSLLS